MNRPRSRIWAFFGAHLSPGERLGEVLCGLVMTLTFTLGASVLSGGSDEASDALMYATIGCNVAWATIDSALLLCARMFERSRLARLGDLIRRSRADDDVLPVVARELDGMLATIAP